MRWLDEVDEDSVHLSAVTLGELREGVDLLAAGRRRDELDRWLREDLPDRFEGRVLPIDGIVAEQWGALRASASRTLPVVDALLAATAVVHELAIVTRNIRDFEGLGPVLVDPWA